jgi:hypothetical protein
MSLSNHDRPDARRPFDYYLLSRESRPSPRPPRPRPTTHAHTSEAEFLAVADLEPASIRRGPVTMLGVAMLPRRDPCNL